MTRKNLLVIAVIVLLPAMMLAASSAFASTVRIVVPAHDIARGDVIGENDLTYATVDGAALMSGVPTKMDEIKGRQARRVLGAGQPFRGDDVRRPIVVIKGQTVTMQFAAPGVELTAMGRAMSEGGVGDPPPPPRHSCPSLGSVMRNIILKVSTAALLGAALSACSAVERIENIG